MNLFMSWLKDNYELIIALVTLIVSVVVAALRKKPSQDLTGTIKADILEFLPFFIEAVECPGNGDIKKQQVITASLVRISKILGRGLSKEEASYWSKFLSSSIEAILTAPQKKEVSKNETIQN